MKAKELKYYKPLDITQLSGSPWNDAEKVLGLDQDDKVIMAEPEETVTPEYVDDAINQAMEAETARTESTYLKQSDIDGDQFPTKNWVKGHTALAIEHSMEDETARTESTYAKKSEIPDMDDYYTKEQVDDLIDDIDVSDQLANYALTTAVTADIQTAIANETARTESTYAKPADIPSLDNYYNKSQVDEKVSGAESYADSIVEGLATETYVDDAIAAIPPVDLSGYAKTTAVTQDIQTAIAAETARTESTYLKQSDIDDDQYPTKNWVKGHTALAIEHSMEEETARTENTYAKIADIPSLDGYATEQYVDDAIADIPSVDLSPYAKTTAVTQDIQTAMAAETARTESTYLKEHQSLDNYYTKSQVDAEITGATEGLASEQYVDDAIAAIPDVDLSPYAKTTAVTQDIQTAIASETARTENTYAKPSQIPSLDGYATEQWVESQGYLTEHQDLSAYAKTTAVTQDIQTAIAAETARTEDVYAKKSEVPDLDDYYTKSETDEAIEEAISGISLEGYWTSAETKNYVDSEITGATASETARTESTYAKKSEIPSLDGYWTSAQTNNAITAATEGLATEAWVTGDTETRIGTAIASETARTENDYIKKSLYSGPYTQNSITKVERSVFNVSYGSVEKHFDTIYTSFVTPGVGAVGAGNSVIVKKINGVSIIENPADTVDESISLPTFSDVSTAITDAIETETARTESTYAKIGDIPSLAGYWTSAETQNAITAATDGLASESYVDASVTSATQDMATETWVGEQGYLTEHQDISGKLDVSVFTGYTGATETILDGKADVSDIPDVSGFVTSGDVETQIDTAMAAETARTEATYLKTHQDISGKLDKTDFNTYTGATETVLNGKLDATAYTQGMASETARTESTYAKPSQIPSLTGYATETWVQAQGYLTQHQDISGKLDVNTFSTYTGATETVLEGKADVSDIPDVSDFVTSGDVANQIDASMAAETARTESTYLKEHQSLDNYYTKSEVDADFVSAATAVGNAIDAAVQGLASENYVDNAVSGLASEGYVDAAVTAATENLASEGYVDAAITSATQNLATEQYVADAIAAIPEPDLSDYYTKSEVDAEITGATEDMATKTWVGQQGYLTQHQDLSGYAKTTAVTEDIETAMAAETARTESTYAKPSQIPSLSGYATEQWVEGKGYLTGYTETDPTVPAWAKQANKPSYTASEVGAATQSDIDSAIAAETARTESVYAKPGDIPSLSGYATEAYVTSAVTAATDDMATKTWVGQQGYLTQHQDISGKLDTSVFTGYTGATETVLSGKVDNSVFTGYTGDTSTALAGKVDTSAYTAYTASTDTAISGKQETLVSGTNIKTINEQSILGSGNSCYAPTTAGTAGQPLLSNGSGAPVWGGYKFAFITQVQYDALSTKDSTTIYFIIGMI